uniref:CHK domain-containing protein n=1 Tax=Trichuris muris TaxID=70415 RepID=A0A5S6QJK5_TRIMR
MNEPLGGTRLNREIIEQVFVDAGKVSPGSLERVSAELVSHSGGYTSHIIRLLLFWKKHDGNLDHPSRALVKMPTEEHFDRLSSSYEPKLAEKLKESYPVNEIFRIECAIYEMLPKELPEFPMPKCYGTWTKAGSGMQFMIIEDLSHIAKTPDLSCGLTHAQLMNCAEALAVLHAWSLNTQYEWKKLLPGPENNTDILLASFEFFGDNMEKTMKKYPGELKCVDVAKVRAILSDKENVIAAMTEYRKLMPDVLAHGDFWSNNILFQVDNETNRTSDRIAAIIDWQISHQGSFAEDLSRLYSFCVNPDVRRSTAKDVFRRYFDRMQILSPEAMHSVSFDRAYHIFEKSLFYYALAMVSFAHQFEMLFEAGDPTLKAVMLNRTVEIYKDAAEFFKF